MSGRWEFSEVAKSTSVLDFKSQYLETQKKLCESAPSIVWKSDVIENREAVGQAKALQILEKVFHDKKFQKEIDGAIGKVGGMQSPRLWNAYFRRGYNAITGMSYGYATLMTEASKHLPSAGHIVDYAGGTGNFSAALLAMSPLRKVTLFDMSAEAMKVARKTVKTLAPQAQFKAVKCDLAQRVPVEGSADGAVVNNALYTLLSKEARLAFLKLIHAELKPGATLILSEPAKEFHQSPKAFEEWLGRVVGSAAYQGSPMNGFDVALYSEVNRRIVNGMPFFDPSQLMGLVHAAGFGLIETPETEFYDIGTFLVLRRLGGMSFKGLN